MHFIHEISWFECFLHRTSFVFQNFHFPRFSIDRGCFSTDRKCVKIFGLNLPAWLVLDQSNIFFNWSNPNFDHSNFEMRLFKRLLLSRVLPILKSFLDFFSLLFFDQSNLSDFYCFLPQNSPRFLSSSIGKTFIPSLFHFNYMFHAFFLKILNIGI